MVSQSLKNLKVESSGDENDISFQNRILELENEITDRNKVSYLVFNPF